MATPDDEVPEPDLEADVELIRRCQETHFMGEGLRRWGAYGSAIGPRIRQSRQGLREYPLCLRVFVRAKVRDHSLLGERLLNETFDFETPQGTVPIRIDVCEFEFPVLHGAPPVHTTPFAGGNAVFVPPTAHAPGLPLGTMGGWAWDKVDRSVVLLSNAHVIGTGPNPIHVRFNGQETQLAETKRGFDSSMSNKVDAAVGDPYSESVFEPSVLNVAPAIIEIRRAKHKWKVEKFGSSTDLQHGVVDSAHWHISDPESGVAYVDCLTVRPAAEGNWTEFGDSGGLVFARTKMEPEETKAVIGLHIGEHHHCGVACHIDNVFDLLQLDTLALAPFAAFLESLFTPVNPAAPFEFLAKRRARGAPAAPAGTAHADELYQEMRRLNRGGSLITLFRSKRVSLLRVLVQRPDIRAAVEQALRPLFEGMATAQAAFARVLGDGDVVKIRAMLHTADEFNVPELTAALAAVEEVVARSAGQTLGAVLDQLRSPDDLRPLDSRS